MDQELKQRLIGAAVITALAAIFVPMLFDDPIDESGKTVNELKIPEVPISGTDVEIMPLPEKPEDVATVAPEIRPSAPTSVEPPMVYEGEEESDVAPRAVISAKEAVPAPVAKINRPVPVEPEITEEEDVPVVAPVAKAKAPTPLEAPVAVVKPAAKPAVSGVPATTIAPAETESASTRWYLNVGTFGKQSNAVALQENLKKQGFAVSVKEVANDKGTVYKVRVGPMLDRAKAQAMKSKLAQINVNSFLAGEE